MKVLLSSIGIAIIFFTYTTVHAQGEMEERIISSDTPSEEVDKIIEDYFGDFLRSYDREVETVPLGDGAMSCFDRYTFNSVQTQIHTNTESTVSGVPMTFTTTVRNENAYPVVNGSLYIKIFKLRNGDEKSANGPYVVDQFLVQERITLNAKEEKIVTFDWNVPVWATAGEYQVATFFLGNHKYNLLGLSFTDDVVGNTTRFSVASDQSTGVMFDKDSVQINNQPYYFAAFPPRVSNTEPVVLRATVQNTTTEEVNVPVTFKIFYWDSNSQNDELKNETVWVTVPAKGKKDVSFTSTDGMYSVYLSEITLRYKDTKSILNPRFVRSGVNRLRINMPMVTTYPLVAGQPVELFSCLHNTAEETVGGRLVLSVIDETGKEVHTYEYNGGVTGEMIGVMDTFVPDQAYSSFTIKAQLYQEEVLVEEDYVKYDCDDLNGCLGNTPMDSVQGFWGLKKVYIPITLISLALIGVFIHSHRRPLIKK